jgi:hypothetical protein
MLGRRSELLARVCELRLPRPERDAARAERLAERQIRLERDNQETAERRAAALAAESRRYRGYIGHP